jgi:nucleoside 2-deoxyribosyltransferase-like protein
MKLNRAIPPHQLIRDNSVGRGRLPQLLHKPIIYFGGRIYTSKNGEPRDWRDSITGFNGIRDADGRRSDETMDCGAFWYGGPFPKSNSGHSDGNGYYNFWDDHRDIWDADAQQIARADLVVAYIDDLQAYGTLVEIGYAAGRNKLIVLGFSNDLAFDDFMELWLCRMPAARVYRGTPEGVWWRIKNDWIAPQTEENSRSGVSSIHA